MPAHAAGRDPPVLRFVMRIVTRWWWVRHSSRPPSYHVLFEALFKFGNAGRGHRALAAKCPAVWVSRDVLLVGGRGRSAVALQAFFCRWHVV